MGYESRIYVITKTRVNGFKTEKKYAQIIAMFDMGKFPALADIMINQPETDSFIYADDGNTQILEDKYGDKLTEATPQIVVDVLEKQLNNGDTYRRIYPLLATLKAVIEHQKNFPDIAVLHYGY